MHNLNDLYIDTFLREKVGLYKDQACARLLDLGCGTRPYAPHFHERVEEYVAGDYDQRTADLDLRLDAQALPFRDDTFDCILFSEVIEHLPDGEKALAEIARVLRPGGVLFITWPFMYMMHEIPHDYMRYTEFGMVRLLNVHGLNVEALVRRGGVIALYSAISEFLLGGFLEGLARLPILGGVFRPLKVISLWFFFKLPTRMYFGCLRSNGLKYQQRPGEALSGWRGHLQHWTLGYCATARKVAIN